MKQITTNQLTVGLNTDIHPKFQEEGTYRFALNSVLETTEGDLGTISNELGNVECAELPYGKKVIGHANTETDEIVLFLYDRNVVTPLHEIGIYNPSLCTYTSLAIDGDLNFSDKYQINAFIRIRNGCERMLYFTDNYNPYRVVNLTNTQAWINPVNKSIIDISKIKYSRDYTHPNIELAIDNLGNLISANSGGNLQLGTYNFTLRYIDEEGNSTNWLPITRPVAVSDNSIQLLDDISTYAWYDGGTNISTEIGFVKNSGKAIGLEVSNISQNFKYFQLAVIKRTSSSGAISGVDILTPQYITGNSAIFIYTGFDSQIESSTSLDELLSENVIVDKVKAHAYLQNELFLGNLSYTYRNYAAYQRHASSTKVEYVKVSAGNVAQKAKNPQYYFGNASFLADETYALGRVYIFKDGSTSPVFHIPGRAPDTNIVGTNPYIVGGNWDTQNMVGDVNIFNTSKTKRWQVYNTATKYNTPDTGHDVTGLMAYYECETTYPVVDIGDCDTHADGFWGRDSNNNLITPGVTKIRHHRMPSHDLVNGSIVTDDYKIGIKFTDTEDYPDPDIVGHFYVYSDRTFEKTILDKGLVTALKSDTDAGVHQAYAGFLTNKSGSGSCASNVLRRVASYYSTYAFISPKTTLEDSYEVGTYLRLEKYLSGSEVSTSITPTAERYNKIIHIQDTFSAYSQTYTTSSQFNYKINWSGFLKKSQVDSSANSVNVPQEAIPVANISIHNNFLLLSTDEKLQPFQSATLAAWNYDKFATVALKADVDVFNDLSKISYIRIGNEVVQKQNGVDLETYSYSGDSFNIRFTAVDYAFARNGSGDVFVTGDVVTVPLESSYAYEFRHEDTTMEGQYLYYKFNPNDPSPIIPLGEYIAEKYYEPTPGESSYFYPETYLLNKSFSYLDSISRFYSLPYNYEYCNDCLTNNPFRVYYSQADNGEDSQDMLRIIKPNNYQDLPGITGNLNDLFVNFSKLYALTDSSIYYIPTRPQQLTTDTNSVYIGTSEVFGVPPVELKITDYHFGGSSIFKSRYTTEYGTFYVDDKNGKPFFLDTQLNDLSLNGMRNFWQENGKLEFLEQFYKITGQSFPIKSTSSDSGVGYLSSYDVRFKRLIVHKKDYEYVSKLPLYYQSTSPSEESVWFNGTFFFYISPALTLSQISFDDPAYFRNRSFTLSYSFLQRRWVSFHSYLPYYMFNNNLSFYTTAKQSQFLFKHLEGEHLKFYGAYYSHILDLIASASPLVEQQYTNIFYSSSMQEKDLVHHEYKNTNLTFNAYIAYNSKQSTGIRILQQKENEFALDYDSVISLVSKVDNKYKISNIRDAVVNEEEALWSTDWAKIQTAPFIYIDKIPNTDNLNYNLSDFKSSRFRDYYLGIRLILFPTKDSKIVTDIINTRTSNRLR